jgi:predicted DNA-binding transcriptional regulator AlpA
MAGVLRRDDRTGLSARHIIAKISDSSFPGQVKIGEHSSHWRESAINQSIADPAAYREKSTGRIQARVGKAFARPATEGLGKLTKS